MPGFQKVQPTPKFQSSRMIQRRIQAKIANRRGGKNPLIAEVVDGQHVLRPAKRGIRAERLAQIWSQQARLPIVRVKDVGAENVPRDPERRLVQQREADVIVGIIDAVFAVDAGTIIKRRAIDEKIPHAAIDYLIDRDSCKCADPPTAASRPRFVRASRIVARRDSAAAPRRLRRPIAPAPPAALPAHPPDPPVFANGAASGSHHQDAGHKRCFCTFPSALRGSFSTASKRRGILKEASFSRQRASSAAAYRVLRPRATTT